MSEDEIKKCKKCKYFKRNDGKYNSKKYGECISNKFEYGTSSDYKDKPDTDKLLYMDYDWYSADFEVGENFGCIHFKSKENIDE